MIKTSLLVLILALMGGCSTLRSSWIRDDYARTDRTEVLRLAVVTAPPPEGDRAVCELFSLVARRYTNQKRDFIAKENRCADTRPVDCPEGIEGLLLLTPEARRAGDKIILAVDGELFRCSDKEAIWLARATGTWPLKDPKLNALAASYGEELGASVVPWVPATFHLLRAMLDTLPMPALMGEDAIMEKIELGE